MKTKKEKLTDPQEKCGTQLKTPMYMNATGLPQRGKQERLTIKEIKAKNSPKLMKNKHVLQPRTSPNYS